MNINYFISQVIILSIFALLYQFVYRNNKQFLLNRIFLLSSVAIAVVVPFLSFNVFPYEEILSQNIAYLKSGVASGSASVVLLESEAVSSFPFFQVIYSIGFAVAFAVFLRQLLSILFKIKSANFSLHNSCYVAKNEKGSSFSFFNFIFIQKADEFIIEHERGHVKLGHSYDRIIFSLIQCVFWFNPFFYLFRLWLIENHEYSADEFAIKSLKIDKHQYGKKLFREAVNLKLQPQLVNKFSSLTKNRIQMLKSKQSIDRVHYLWILLAVILIFPAFTFKSYPIKSNVPFSLSLDSIPAGITHFGYAFTTDSLPDNLNRMDTSVIFDPKTYEEQYLINKSSALTKPFELPFKLSGKQKASIDTLVTFNTKTYKESIHIMKKSLPAELFDYYSKLNEYEKQAVDLQYGDKQTLAIQFFESDKDQYIYFEGNHKGFELSILDEYGSAVTKRVMQRGTRLGVDNLNLKEGKYVGVRSDNQMKINIEVM